MGWSYLDKDSEEDDSDDGSEEHLSQGCPKVILIQQEAQGEGDGASQATICHYELVLGGQLDNTELVDHECQTNHACKGQHDEKLRLSVSIMTLCVRHFYNLYIDCQYV